MPAVLCSEPLWQMRGVTKLVGHALYNEAALPSVFPSLMALSCDVADDTMPVIAHLVGDGWLGWHEVTCGDMELHGVTWIATWCWDRMQVVHMRRQASCQVCEPVLSPSRLSFDLT